MTVSQLKEKATASELTLIEAVITAVEQQALSEVLNDFADLLNERLHPREMHDVRQVHETIRSCVKQLKTKFNDPSNHEG